MNYFAIASSPSLCSIVLKSFILLKGLLSLPSSNWFKAVYFACHADPRSPSYMVSGLENLAGIGGKRTVSCGRSDRSFLHRKMSDGAVGEPGLFDDDDPFNLPPPLPPLSPERENDAANQDGVGDQTKKEPTKKRRVNRSPRPRLDEVRWVQLFSINIIDLDVHQSGKEWDENRRGSNMRVVVLKLIDWFCNWQHRPAPCFVLGYSTWYVFNVVSWSKYSTQHIASFTFKREFGSLMGLVSVVWRFDLEGPWGLCIFPVFRHFLYT